MDLLLTTILGGVILYCLYYLLSKRCKYWEDRGFPCTDGAAWIKEDFSHIFFPTKGNDDRFIEMYNKTNGHGYCGIFMFFLPRIIVRDPEVIYDILIKDFSYFCDRGHPIDEELEPLSGHLFGLKGDRWRGLRYKLAPTFTSGKLKSMVSQINDCSDEIISFIDKNREPAEIRELMYRYTLNVIGSVAFGMRVDAHKNMDGGKNEFVENARSFFQMSVKKISKLMVMLLFTRLGKLLRLTFIDKKTNDFFMNVIKDAIKYRKDTETKRNDFLQLLINIKEKDEQGGDKQAREKIDLHEEQHDDLDKELLENMENMKHNSSQYKFTEKSVAANSFIFIVGGTETTATAITFALYEIAANSDIQNKLHDEIDKFLPDEKLDYSAISSMTYLDRVVKETLRKHSPVSSLDRKCVKDYNIPGTNYVIKKGEELIIPVVAIHHDPNLFPDPEKFDPDRFLDPNTIKKGTYLPFGAGPRFCIAMRFAQLEVKSFLVTTLKTYNVKLSEKTKLPLTYKKHTFAKTIECGLWLEFEHRK